MKTVVALSLGTSLLLAGCSRDLAGRTGPSQVDDAGSPQPEDAGSTSTCGQCTPTCADRQCGHDGCGGSCGSCEGGMYCYWHECMFVDPPFCQGRNCGPDGVGGECGVCPAGWTCGWLGCEPDGGCAALPAGGTCVEGTLVTCLNGEVDLRPCPYGECLVESGPGVANCAPVGCLPDCFGKACGNDGCNNSCGTCTVGERCDPDRGICVPDDAWVDRPAHCSGGYLVSSAVDKGLHIESCLAKGRACGLDPCDGAVRCLEPKDVPCDDALASGHCEGGYLFQCVDGRVQVTDCEAAMGMDVCSRVGTRRFGCGGY